MMLICRMADEISQLSVHDGNHCHCLMTMPEKYRQVLTAHAERYADIADFLLTVDSYSNYAVRESSDAFLKVN